ARKRNVPAVGRIVENKTLGPHPPAGRLGVADPDAMGTRMLPVEWLSLARGADSGERGVIGDVRLQVQQVRAGEQRRTRLTSPGVGGNPRLVGDVPPVLGPAGGREDGRGRDGAPPDNPRAHGRSPIPTGDIAQAARLAKADSGDGSGGGVSRRPKRRRAAADHQVSPASLLLRPPPPPSPPPPPPPPPSHPPPH